MSRKIFVLALVAALSLVIAIPSFAGVNSANGWYNGEMIYYLDLGPEKQAVGEQALTDIFLIGGNRTFQPNVVEHVPGDAGYTPHWDVNVVHTAEGVTLADILASGFASEYYPEVLFDSAEDILAAEAAGFVTIEEPGVVVLCPVTSEQAAEAPGNMPLPEDFAPFPDTF